MNRLCWMAGIRGSSGTWSCPAYLFSSPSWSTQCLLNRKQRQQQQRSWLSTTTAHDYTDEASQNPDASSIDAENSYTSDPPTLKSILSIPKTAQRSQYSTEGQLQEGTSKRKSFQASMERQLYSFWDKHPSNTFRILSKAIRRHDPTTGPLPVSLVMYLSALKAAAQLGHLSLLHTLLDEARDAGFCTTLTYNNLIHTFAKTGNAGVAWCIKEHMKLDGLSLEEKQRAYLIIGYLKDRNIEMALMEWYAAQAAGQSLRPVVWTRLIYALYQVHEGKAALEVMLAAQVAGVHPHPSQISKDTVSTWEWVLHASVHGRYLRGIDHAFRQLLKVDNWPGMDHQLGKAMFTLLGDWGAAGLAEEIFYLLSLRSSFQIDPVIWGLFTRAHITGERHQRILSLLNRFMQEEDRWLPAVNSPQEAEENDEKEGPHVIMGPYWKRGYETMIEVAFSLPAHKSDLILPAQIHLIKRLGRMIGTVAYTEKVQYLHWVIAAHAMQGIRRRNPVKS